MPTNHTPADRGLRQGEPALNEGADPDVAQAHPSKTGLKNWAPRHTRSVGFLESDGTRWACYLVTYQSSARRWCGYLTFRDESDPPTTLRTTDVFIETDERSIEGKARQLGKPLLIGLLASAQSLAEKERRAADDRASRRASGNDEASGQASGNDQAARRAENDEAARRTTGIDGNPTNGPARPEGAGKWMRDQVRQALGVRRHRGASPHPAQRELGLQEPAAAPDTPESEASDRSAYETYCLDQITHLVGLIPEPLFGSVVERLLDGETFSFGAKDRLQFSLIAVQRLEGLLRLPPFEVWRADRRAHPIAHERYHHDLHRGVLD